MNSECDKVEGDTQGLKYKIGALFIVGVILGAALSSMYMVNHYRGGVWVPCGIAEISPDVPPKLKEFCRSQRNK